MLLEAAKQFGVAGVCGRGLGEQHNIDTRELMYMGAKAFTGKAPQSVAANRPGNAFFRDGKTNSRSALVSQLPQDRKITIG